MNPEQTHGSVPKNAETARKWLRGQSREREFSAWAHIAKTWSDAAVIELLDGYDTEASYDNYDAPDPIFGGNDDYAEQMLCWMASQRSVDHPVLHAMREKTELKLKIEGLDAGFFALPKCTHLELWDGVGMSSLEGFGALTTLEISDESVASELGVEQLPACLHSLEIPCLPTEGLDLRATQVRDLHVTNNLKTKVLPKIRGVVFLELNRVRQDADIQSLSVCTGLTELQIDFANDGQKAVAKTIASGKGNPFTLQPLEPLLSTSLKRLWLRWYKSNPDLDVLDDAAALEELEIAGDLTQPLCLSHAQNLRKLVIRDLAEGQPVHVCVDAIEEIEFERAKLRDCDCVANATRLRRFSIRSRELVDIEALGTCQSLEHVDLRRCPKLASLNALTSLPKLRRVAAYITAATSEACDPSLLPKVTWASMPFFEDLNAGQRPGPATEPEA